MFQVYCSPLVLSQRSSRRCLTSTPPLLTSWTFLSPFTTYFTKFPKIYHSIAEQLAVNRASLPHQLCLRIEVPPIYCPSLFLSWRSSRQCLTSTPPRLTSWTFLFRFTCTFAELPQVDHSGAEQIMRTTCLQLRFCWGVGALSSCHKSLSSDLWSSQLWLTSAPSPLTCWTYRFAFNRFASKFFKFQFRSHFQL